MVLFQEDDTPRKPTILLYGLGHISQEIGTCLKMWISLRSTVFIFIFSIISISLWCDIYSVISFVTVDLYLQ
jgi:hypothetical protein